MDILTGIILLAIGLVACFYGKRLYRIILALAGFAIGFYAMTVILNSRTDFTVALGALIGGLVLSFLFWRFYKFGYFLFGLYLGLVLAALIANAFNLGLTLFGILAVVLGIAGAVAGYFLAVTMIRLSTAFGGATQAVAGLAALAVALGLNLPLVDPTIDSANTTTTASIVTFIAVIALGTVGFLFQMRHKIEYLKEEMYYWGK